MATVIPRSLNDPVGLAPSNLRYTLAPTRSPSLGAGSSGVAPSCRVTTGVAPLTGRNRRYSVMTPLQPGIGTAALPRPDHAQQRPHPVDDVELAQVGQRGLHGPFLGGVRHQHEAGL